MIELAAKILVATAFYVAVLWLARRSPRATGMMLTFPTLNGIVLVMAAPAALEAAAGAMILMPPLNAVLCASYLAGFERLTRAGGDDDGAVPARLSPAAASGLLVCAFSVVWLALAGAIVAQHWVMPSRHQAGYAVVAVLAGVLLTWGSRPGQPLAMAPPPPPFAVLLARNRARIGLFVLTLTSIAVVDRLGGAPAILGVLAGLPVVALFGLQSIASDAGTPLDGRRNAFAAMASSVWLGPGIAILFVATLWRLLAGLTETASGPRRLLIATALLLASWALCGLAIWGLTRLIPLVGRARMATRTP